MECKHCEYCKYRGQGISAGYRCTHGNVEESARDYEKQLKRTITKSKDFIGKEMPKTSLRWCPRKKGK